MKDILIDIPKYTRFGLEIETENVNPSEVKKLVEKIDPLIVVKQDRSLEAASAEIETPVYRNKKEDIEKLRKLSRAIKKLNPDYSGCSFQVNLDMHLYESSRLELLKAFLYYEKVIFRYSRGNDYLIRESARMYSDLLLFDLGFKLHRYGFANPEILLEYEHNKRYGVALKSDIDVIEFRTPNGTHDIKLWMDYIKTFYYFLDSIREERQDIEKIDYYIERKLEEGDENYSLSNRYFDINEELVSEFVKTTFTNDADRGAFIKRYRKN